MRFTGHFIRLFLALILAGSSVLGVGCASTKNVMNKATFGLVGGQDNAAKEQKRAEKQERKREKAAEKQTKKEAKRAEKEAQASNEERGFWNKATFGLVGGGSEDKTARKEAKRQAEEEKKAQKRLAKEQKRAKKQAREQEKQMAKTESSDDSEPGFWNKATFGLVGGDPEEKATKKEAKRQAKEEKKSQKRTAKEQKEAEKQARKQEKQIAKAQSESTAATEASEDSERGFWNKATFGLVGGDSEDEAAKQEAKRQAEEEKKEQKRAANEQKKAEKKARKEEKQMAKAESDEEPKRGLMSKLTFGLVGGGEDDVDQTVEEEMPVSTPEPPVSMPAGESGFDAESASNMGPDERKLAKLPFETSISYDSLSASGKQQAVANRATYSKHDYGITDLGDVRIAVRDMTFSGGTTGGRIIISSEDRAKASGTAGIGNESFSFDYEKGVTNCTFGTIRFSIEQGVITIDGRSVPMGQGHKLVMLDEQGNVEGVYNID